MLSTLWKKILVDVEVGFVLSSVPRSKRKRSKSVLIASLCTKSQSQLSLKAARLLQVALGVISSFTPFMLRNSRKPAACAGCVFSPLAPRPCRPLLCALTADLFRHSLPSLLHFKDILMDKFSIITVFESSWSPSSRFGSNPAISLPASCEIPKKRAACAGCVFSLPGA